MKAKPLLLAVAGLLVAGGLWAARAAWRAHCQLVTLDIPNAPLSSVLRKIEWQVWRKIRAEESLANVRVTLHVKDTPLPEVLDRLAEQAGARWNTLYAVYRGKRALQALDAALRGDGKLDPAGWTKLAPNAAALVEAGTDQAGLPVPKPGDTPEAMPGGPPDGEGDLSFAPSFAPPPDGPGQMVVRKNGGMIMLARQGPGGAMIIQSGPSGQVEMWSPQELVMESSLSNRLGGDLLLTNIPPTTAAAAQTARKAGGRWTSYLAFHRSSMGIGFKLPRGRPNPGQMPHPPDPNRRFSDLTPQQRVERARQRLGVYRPEFDGQPNAK